MFARFLVSESFPITVSSRQLFVLAGDIVEGTIKSGMQVVIPFNSALSLKLPIHGVEFVDRMESPESKVALTIRCDNKDELQMLLDLDLRAEEIEVRDQENEERGV